MQDILALPRARVPVIKFLVGASGTKVSDGQRSSAAWAAPCLLAGRAPSQSPAQPASWLSGAFAASPLRQ